MISHTAFEAAGLTDRQRGIYLRRFVLNHPWQRIASDLGITREEAKVSAARAVGLLSRCKALDMPASWHESCRAGNHASNHGNVGENLSDPLPVRPGHRVRRGNARRKR